VQRRAFEQDREVALAEAGDDALRFVSVGTAVPEHEVRVLDADGAPLPEGEVGRIAFRGPSMTPGYFGKPEATAAITAPDGFLDSGDLGFVHEGELYVAGRKKDLIIKAGRNLVPQEIEEIAADVPGVRRGCVAAFGVPLVELGTEGLVVVAETRATDNEERGRIEADIVQRVSESLGVPPDVVRLVPPGSVPKTSSGKIRRAESRDLYLRGALGDDARRGRTPWRIVAAAALSEARARVRPLRRLLYAAWVVAWALLLLPPFLLLAHLWPAGRALRRYGRAGARLAMRVTGVSLERVGADLPPGPSVLVANHASFADVPVLMAALDHDFVFVAKAEMATWPVLGRLVRRTEQLTVDRFDAGRGLADWQGTVDALRAGRSVLFFPEGTFTAATGLRPFKLGAFQAAAAAGLPVVPVTLVGTRAALRDGAWIPRPTALSVVVDPALQPDGADWAAAIRLRDQAATAIAARCGEPRLDLRTAGPERGA